jgi:hypothetical protein
MTGELDAESSGRSYPPFWFDRRKASFESNVAGLRPAFDPASLGLPVVGGDARFAPIVRCLGGMRVYAIEPAKLREMQDPDSGTSSRTAPAVARRHRRLRRGLPEADPAQPLGAGPRAASAKRRAPGPPEARMPGHLQLAPLIERWAQDEAGAIPRAVVVSPARSS